MNGTRRLVFALLAVGALSGCQGARSRRAVAVAEPGLSPHDEAGIGAVAVAPAQPVTFADRHPLFAKPREYYTTTGSNKAAKIAAATVVGIPAGIVGELRQIVVGQPPAATY